MRRGRNILASPSAMCASRGEEREAGSMVNSGPSTSGHTCTPQHVHTCTCTYSTCIQCHHIMYSSIHTLYTCNSLRQNAHIYTIPESFYMPLRLCCLSHCYVPASVETLPRVQYCLWWQLLCCVCTCGRFGTNPTQHSDESSTLKSLKQQRANNVVV